MINMNKKFDEDWYDSSITKFPKIKSALTNRNQRQSKIHEKLKIESKIRQQEDVEKTIQDYDRNIDINYYLKRNPKYVNSKRNLKPISSFFDRSIVNRIVINVSKNNKKGNHDYENDNFARNLADANKGASHDCKRHKKNCQAFEDNEFRRIFFSVSDNNLNEGEENTTSNSEIKSSLSQNSMTKLTPIPSREKSKIEKSNDEKNFDSNSIDLKETELNLVEEIENGSKDVILNGSKYDNRSEQIPFTCLSPIESIPDFDGFDDVIEELTKKEAMLDREESIITKKPQQIGSAYYKKQYEDSNNNEIDTNNVS